MRIQNETYKLIKIGGYPLAPKAYYDSELAPDHPEVITLLRQGIISLPEISEPKEEVQEPKEDIIDLGKEDEIAGPDEDCYVVVDSAEEPPEEGSDNLTRDEVLAMKYNELKKLASKLGLGATGKAKHLRTDILSKLEL